MAKITLIIYILNPNVNSKMKMKSYNFQNVNANMKQFENMKKFKNKQLQFKAKLISILELLGEIVNQF